MNLSRKRNCTETAGNVSKVTINESVVYAIKEKKLYQYSDDIEKLLSAAIFECVTELEYLLFENKLWFGTGEELVYYSPELDVVSTIDLDSAFVAAVWNPTQEILTVVHCSSEVATYIVDYENCYARCLGRCPMNTAVPQTVYVGWGSANTQFRGSEGKLKPNTKTEGN